jgi:pimeloyl-ACP methyl ester carboxylesterase
LLLLMSRMPIEEPAAQYFEAGDGVRLAWREVGEGRPLVLLHGYLANGLDQWLRTGHPARLAAAGHRVVLPDLRAHGASDAPRDPALYPADRLLGDTFELIDHLGLEGYDLAGYSLGGRIVARMVALGAPARRAVIAGIGLDETLAAAGRGDHYRELLGDPGAVASNPADERLLRYVRATGLDPEALLLVLNTFADTAAAAIAAIDVPTLVLVGNADERRDSAERLAAAIPNAEFRELTGDHSAAPRDWMLGDSIAEFLAVP